MACPTTAMCGPAVAMSSMMPALVEAGDGGDVQRFISFIIKSVILFF